MVDDAKLDKQEVKHGALCSNATVDFTHHVDVFFGLDSLHLLLLDLQRSLLSDFKGLNKSLVLQDSVGVSVGQVLEQVRFELSELNLESVLLFH